MSIGIIIGVIAGVIVVAVCAAGFFFYRAYQNEQAKKKNMAGKWSGAYSSGNSTLPGSDPRAPPPVRTK